MHRSGVVFATGALLIVSCAGSGPRIQMGPNAVKTPDGLHRVDGVVVGTLFMKPDYAVGDYHEFVLAGTDVTFAQGSRVLEGEELNELVDRLDGLVQTEPSTGRRRACCDAGAATR